MKDGMRAHAPAEGYRALALAHLRRLAGFEAVDEALITAWVEAGRLSRVRRGEAIRRRGEACDGLLLVVEGAVAAGRGLGLPDAHLLAYLGPGDIAEPVALFDGGPRMHDLVAHEPTVLLTVPPERVSTAVVEQPAVRHAMVLQVAHRNRLLYDRLFDQVSLPLSARLARQLHLLGRSFGTLRPGGLLISIRVSQADLAHMLGASRQQVNAELKRFAERGLVSRSTAGFLIHDVAALETTGGGTLALTLKRQDGSDGAAARPAVPGAARGPLHGLHVLLVDDDPVTRLLLAAQLEHEGAHVDQAEHGAAAVAAVRAADRRYDLIVMDEQMPVLSGVGATRDIRAFQAEVGQPATPVLGVSSAAGRNDRRRYFAAGMNAHLAKPFTRQELLAAVLRLLGPP